MRAGLALLAAALATALAAGAGAAEDVAALVREMGGEDTARRHPAYVKLQGRRDPAAIPLILESLARWETTPQQYGVLVLAAYPPDVARPALERVLASPSRFARVAAGATLVRWGHPKAAAAVAGALGAKDLDVATSVAMLGQVSSLRDDAVQAAARRFLAPDGDPAVVGAALAYFTTVPDAAAREAAAALLADARAGVRAIAAAFLVRQGDESRADALAQALASGEATHADFTRVHSLLHAAPRVPEPVLEAAARLLDGETDRYYLAAVVGFLGHHGYAKASSVLRRLLDHPEPVVAKAAFDALSKVPGALSPDDLRALLASPDETRRVAAAEALRRLDDVSGLPAAAEVLAKGSSPAARSTAATAVGTFRSPAAVEALLAALSDGDASVRAAAFSALGTLLQAVFPYRRIDLSTTGWNASAPADAREPAVARLRAWWETHRAKDW